MQRKQLIYLLAIVALLVAAPLPRQPPLRPAPARCSRVTAPTPSSNKPKRWTLSAPGSA